AEHRAGPGLQERPATPTLAGALRLTPHEQHGVALRSDHRGNGLIIPRTPAVTSESWLVRQGQGATTWPCNFFRSTLPVALSGSSSRMVIASGTLYPAIRSPTNCRSSAGVGRTVTSCLSDTYATTRWPRCGSGTPTTQLR